jgi:hypothetical protein
MVDAALNEATAKYCLEAFRAVTQALREAGQLAPKKPAAAKAPPASTLAIVTAEVN